MAYIPGEELLESVNVDAPLLCRLECRLEDVFSFQQAPVVVLQTTLLLSGLVHPFADCIQGLLSLVGFGLLRLIFGLKNCCIGVIIRLGGLIVRVRRWGLM